MDLGAQPVYNPNDGYWWVMAGPRPVYDHNDGYLVVVIDGLRNPTPPGFGDVAGQHPQVPQYGFNNFGDNAPAALPQQGAPPPPGFRDVAGQHPQVPQYGFNNFGDNAPAALPQHGGPPPPVYDAPAQQAPERQHAAPGAALLDVAAFVELAVRESDLNLMRSSSDRWLREGLMSYQVWEELHRFLGIGGPVPFLVRGGQMDQWHTERAAWLIMQVADCERRDLDRR